MKIDPEESSLLDEIDHSWRNHSLYWLEALSLMRSYSVAVLSTANVIEILKSALRRLFKDEEPKWITTKPEMEPEWSACLQTLQTDNKILSVDCSPDGKLIAAGGQDRTSVAFLHNNHQIASGSDDLTIKIWDVRGGDCVRTLVGHTKSIESVILSPARKIISCDGDGIAKIWDYERGLCLNTIDTHVEYSGLIALSPDGNRLACGYGVIKIWDICRVECLRTLEGFIGSISAIIYSSNRQIIAAETLSIMIWDVESGKCLKTFGRIYQVYSLAFSIDDHILSSSTDGRIEVWSPKSDDAPKILVGHTDKVTSMALLPSGKVISGSEDCTVRIWDPRGTCSSLENQYHGGSIYNLDTFPDGHVSSTTSEGEIKIWSPNGALERTLQGSYSSMVCLSSKGHILSESNGRVDLWNANGTHIRTAQNPHPYVKWVAFSLDATQFALGSYGTSINIWDTSSCKPLEQSPEYDRQHWSQFETFKVLHHYVMNSQNSWVTWKGQNVILVPWEYRPLVQLGRQVKETPTGLAIASYSRRVLIFNFSAVEFPP
ncbi:WD domain-containing protein [Penicillium malachiteum]|uniref:WD domain-containing protein n=1 Tax=Penicillium malachiteum TaxID=1324776 RepID=UPI002548BF48|nr:WD domain-containing protein [Penicillium malachiteum]KAJ5728974.1 WD domain-containing protein [Penicillium malachiteum]